MSLNADFIPNFVCYDLEWTIPKTAGEVSNIYLACFVDSRGREKVFHFNHYNGDRKKFLTDIIAALQTYMASMGFATTFEGSDNYQLFENCARFGVKAYIEKRSGFEDGDASYWPEGRDHIDVHKIYTKKLVKNYVYYKKYRTGRLDDIAKGVLGHGKYNGINGADAEGLSEEEQIRYCMQDAKLVLELVNHNNGEIMKLMQAFAKITGLPFAKVCNQEVGSYWAKILKDLGADELYKPDFRVPAPKPGEVKKDKFKGGNVIEPTVGVYKNLKVVDVTSLYPSMIINQNISFETINCLCCHDDPLARVPAGVTKSTIGKDYWICRKKEGIFSAKERVLKLERVADKKVGDLVMSDGKKIVLNSGFGVFGNAYFRYSDIRVAELIPAFGRFKQEQMNEIAPRFGFKTVYGDTDSLFFDEPNGKGDIEGFLQACKNELGIDVEFEKEFKICFIVAKKHYFGRLTNGKTVVKGMEGMKRDRPRFVNAVFDEFVKDVCDEKDPRPALSEAIRALHHGEIDAEKLRFSVVLTKKPSEYASDVVQKRLGTQLGLRKNDELYYFKTAKGDSLNPVNLDKSKVKDALIECIRETCSLLKLDIRELEADPLQCSMKHFF